MKKRFLFVLLMAAMLVLTGCRASEKQYRDFQTIADTNFPGAVIGVKAGMSSVDDAEAYYSEAEVLILSGDALLDLESGNIDAYAASSAKLDNILATRPDSGFRILEGEIGVDNAVVAGISRKASYPNIKRAVNDFLRYAKDEGILDDVYRRWVIENDTEMPDIPVPQNPTSKLVVGTTGSTVPFSFYQNEQLTGMDIELIRRLALYLNAELEIKIMDFFGVITALETGDCDCVFANLNATPERMETMDFSDPVYISRTRVLVYDARLDRRGGSWTENIRNSFVKTFIRENRWHMILRGVGMTMLITLYSVLLGTALGFGLCMLRRGKNRLLRALVKAYIRIMQGTPHIVLLMILFYIVFSGSGVAAEWVAVLAFALNFGAYSCEIMRSGIDAVDHGQTEAALAIGYKPIQAFFRIVMPQALVHFLPVYKGEIITLMKMTSVVGYITVQDLTKVSDLIRSRTYEAFFPLISTALIYFALSAVLSALLNLLFNKVAPDRKHRIVKGVKMK